MCHYHRRKSAFTIVELLVVIVVIGILATITIVSYNGITKRAALASLQSDLSNAATKLKSYQTLYGSYPTLDTNNCPTAPTVDSNYCLKLSPGISIATAPFAGYIPNNSTTPQTFSLTLSSNDIQGIITESSKPSVLTPAPLDPVADWIATPQGDHYGNYYDPVSKSWANVTRSTPKTIYDPTTQHIYDVPANYLAVNPWSVYQPGGNGSAAVIEEARTNYVINSYGTSNSVGKWTTGWGNPSMPTGSITYSLANGTYSTNGAQRIQYTGLSSDTSRSYEMMQSITNMLENEIVTLSGYYINNSVGINPRALIHYHSPTTYLGSSSVVLDQSSTFSKFTWTATLPVGTTWIRVGLNVGGIDVNDTIDITLDAIQLEKGSFATSYIPTTTAAVTRNRDDIRIPTIGWNPAAGSIVGVAGVPAKTDAAVLLTWRSSTAGNYHIHHHGAGMFKADCVLGGVESISQRAVATYPYVGVATWGSTLRGYASGVVGSPTPNVTPLPSPEATALLGSYTSVGYNYEAPIARLTVYDIALSDLQIASLNSLINGP